MFECKKNDLEPDKTVRKIRQLNKALELLHEWKSALIFERDEYAKRNEMAFLKLARELEKDSFKK